MIANLYCKFTNYYGLTEIINISKSTIEVYNAIVSSPSDTRAELIVKLNVSESTVNRAILELKH